jgi:hypothetical protein
MRKATSFCLAADGAQNSKSSSVITRSQGVIQDTGKNNQSVACGVMGLCKTPLHGDVIMCQGSHKTAGCIVDAEKIARVHYELVAAQNCLMPAFGNCKLSVEAQTPCLVVQI